MFSCAPQQLNPLASQVAAAAAMGSIAGSQVFGNTLSNLQGATGQLVTNAQGQVSAACQPSHTLESTTGILPQ